jgi:hypothetical protein
MASTSPGSGSTAGTAALSAASADANNGVIIGVGECLVFVRSVFGLSSSYPTAADAWNAIPSPEQITTGTPPAGVPVYWTGGESGDGHVALSAGDGNVYSTDFGPNGYVGDGRVRETTIDVINEDKDLHYAGWSPNIGTISVNSGALGTVYNTQGTGETTVSGTAPTSSGSSISAGDFLTPITNIFQWFEGGLERIALFVGGILILLVVLHKAA